MTLDVGAVAKGYAVEAAAAAAEARGLQSALLNIGGNVRAIGEKANGEGPWTAGVTNPWGGDPAYIQPWNWPTGAAWSSAAITSGTSPTKGSGIPT